MFTKGDTDDIPLRLTAEEISDYFKGKNNTSRYENIESRENINFSLLFTISKDRKNSNTIK